MVQLDTQLQRTLDQKPEIKESEGEIERIRAQGRLKEEDNKTQVTKNTYDVERAKLEVSKQEILAAIEGEKAKLVLSDAGQKLQEVQIKLKSDQSGTTADVESQKQKREKALFEVREAERSIVAMSLKAPVDGLATIMPNWRAQVSWGNAPEFKEGDRAWAGAAIVELPDLTSVRVTGRVEETNGAVFRRGKQQASRSTPYRPRTSAPRSPTSAPWPNSIFLRGRRQRILTPRCRCVKATPRSVRA